MKNQVIGSFEEVVEQAGGAIKQNFKAFAKATTNQVTGDKGTNEQANSAKSQMSDDQAKSFLKDLYGSSGKNKDEKSKETEEVLKGKTPEEAAEIQKLRNELHQDYYQSLVNPPKPQEEERPAEKVEKEKQEDEWEIAQKEKKKPPPLPPNVKQGTGEKVVGVSG